MVQKIASIVGILFFGALLLKALIDRNSTGIMFTCIMLAIVCFYSLFEFVPALRRWNNKDRAQSPPR